MSVLVTGASGFIGKPLVEALANAGYGGVATGRKPPSNLPRDWESFGRAEFLRSPASGGGVDVVVHLEVKQHATLPSAADLVDFQTVNVDGTREWLAWAENRNVTRFVCVSYVKAVRNKGGLTEETALSEHQDPYGCSKAAAEAVVREWAAASRDRAALILRLAPVYGPGNQANLAAFTRQILRGRPCLVGRGNVWKSILSRRNAVAAMLHLLPRMKPGCEVFNVADPAPVHLSDVARQIAEVGTAPEPRGLPWPVAMAIARLGDVLQAITGRPFPLDSRRLKTLTQDAMFSVEKLMRTGFVPAESTWEGIAEMTRWVGSHSR